MIIRPWVTVALAVALGWAAWHLAMHAVVFAATAETAAVLVLAAWAASAVLGGRWRPRT